MTSITGPVGTIEQKLTQNIVIQNCCCTVEFFLAKVKQKFRNFMPNYDFWREKKLARPRQKRRVPQFKKNVVMFEKIFYNIFKKISYNMLKLLDVDQNQWFFILEFTLMFSKIVFPIQLVITLKLIFLLKVLRDDKFFQTKTCLNLEWS